MKKDLISEFDQQGSLHIPSEDIERPISLTLARYLADHILVDDHAFIYSGQ
jgi:hypothetical protein